MSSKSLVVVESPTKAKTISRYIGPEFSVIATVGHVKDLPERELGVDVEKDFQPRYEIIPGKRKVLKQIREAARSVDAVYLAPDPDREGEAIAWHVAEEINGSGKNIYRVLFNEITPRAVQQSLRRPAGLDKRKFDAQQARRILDRLVGYQISPLLWRKVKRGLSAGRVQSVAVRLICDREAQIRAFTPVEYWTIHAQLEGRNPPPFSVKLAQIEGKKAELHTESEALAWKKRLEGETFRVTKVEKKHRKRNPPPPFVTSTLQQEASKRYRFSPRRTMEIAQRLYEGVELGSEGLVGLISYMRTDSTRVSDEALSHVRGYIQNAFGADYLPHAPRYFKQKKGSQDAHEAIRPTYVEKTPETVKHYLNRDQLKLYELIWERFVASQMKAAEFDQTTIEVAAGPCRFQGTGSVMRFEGYMRVYGDVQDADSEQAAMPALEEGERLSVHAITAEQHFTQPPARYTESSLIKELEEKGIGRPSTYAAILSTILEKRYVRLSEGKFYPTELGETVNQLLVQNFPALLSVEFTATMEASLDRIEEGRTQWIQVLKEFYGPFQEDLRRAMAAMTDIRKQGTPTDIPCERCGRPMVIKFGVGGAFLACSGYPACRNSKEFKRDEQGNIEVVEEAAIDQYCPLCKRPLERRHGRYGPFLACSGYPECGYTRRLSGNDRTHETVQAEGDEVCERCGGKLVLRRSRAGNRFWACQNYPKCKGAKPYGTGVSCDRCQTGEFVERASRAGRIFYSCSNYPACKTALQYAPVPVPCPECGAPYQFEKTDRHGNKVVFCRHHTKGKRKPRAGSPALAGAPVE
jgi:DNA topoisomerase-1